MMPVILAAACLPRLATAAFVDNFRDWNLYVHQDGQGKVCYIASVPTKGDGNYSRRGPAAVLVAKLPSAPPNEQVSVQPGYTYLKGSTVELTVDNRTWELFTQGEHAWAKTGDDDAAIVKALQRGRVLTVKGTSAKQTWSLDTYSLNGFTAAYQAMLEACKRG